MKGSLVLLYRPRFLNFGMASISRTDAELGSGTRQLYEMIETLHGPTTRTIGNRSTTRRYSVTRGFVAPKWAKDFSLGRSPRNPRKSHQALKAFQTKLRSATERGKKLAFLRPYRAGRILDSFPGASPQAFVFRPFQGVRSPTRRYADTPIRFSTTASDVQKSRTRTTTRSRTI